MYFGMFDAPRHVGGADSEPLRHRPAPALGGSRFAISSGSRAQFGRPVVSVRVWRNPKGQPYGSADR